MISITLAQIRGARELLEWSRHDLAKAAGSISERTLGRLESGEGAPHDAMMVAIRDSLEAAGISFFQDGMRFR